MAKAELEPRTADHSATLRPITVCGPWSATFPKMIKYLVEKKNTLNNERYRDLLISILSHDKVSAFLLWVKDAKLKFVDRYVNLSFLKFGVLRHRKLLCHVYLACE